MKFLFVFLVLCSACLGLYCPFPPLDTCSGITEDLCENDENCVWDLDKCVRVSSIVAKMMDNNATDCDLESSTTYYGYQEIIGGLGQRVMIQVKNMKYDMFRGATNVPCWGWYKFTIYPRGVERFWRVIRRFSEIKIYDLDAQRKCIVK